MTSLSAATAAGAVTLLDHTDNYAAATAWTGRPLESADVNALVATITGHVAQTNLVLPDASTLIERIVVAALGGHLILAGPPGTGKTTLALLVAEAFGCTVTVETATADWSSYDVIGGLRPKIVGSGDMATEVLAPWLGHVTRAALRCADTIARHDHDPAAEPHQAHWLVIDEFSRAEIDKAIGGLYTALSGTQNEIRLWFGDAPERQAVYLPARFRIVGTMNSVDTAYVYSFSQGLTRRFQFIYVGVPDRDQLAEEITAAELQAGRWYAATYDQTVDHDDPTAIAAAAQAFASSAEVAAMVPLLTKVIEFVRYGDDSTHRPGWPIGTAQLVDVMRQIRLRHGSGGQSLTPALDLALADRVIPQMSGLIRDQIEALDALLAEPELADLIHTRRAVRQLRETQNTQFA